MDRQWSSAGRDYYCNRISLTVTEIGPGHVEGVVVGWGVDEVFEELDFVEVIVVVIELVRQKLLDAQEEVL